MGGTMRWAELRMCRFWAGGISSFPFSRAREYRLLRRLKPNPCHVHVGNADVLPVPIARDLGVWLDSNLSMSCHITKTCGAAFYWLHNIKRISKFLARENLLTVIHAFVANRLDYCNGLLYGLPNTELIKLQRVQNAAARLVTSTRKYDHITPILRQLH